MACVLECLLLSQGYLSLYKRSATFMRIPYDFNLVDTSIPPNELPRQCARLENGELAEAGVVVLDKKPIPQLEAKKIAFVAVSDDTGIALPARAWAGDERMEQAPFVSSELRFTSGKDDEVAQRNSLSNEPGRRETTE